MGDFHIVAAKIVVQMSPLEKIIVHFPHISDEQKAAVSTTDGPMLIIAGPGTGKTFVFALRTLYLILSGKATPSEIVLTTFTEKAAFELRDRISQMARELGLKAPLHEIKIGTIHSICDSQISKYITHTPLKRNYVVLDELTQYLFIFEHFNEIMGEQTDGKYLGRWSSKWSTIKGVIPYFNKITEELIDSRELSESESPSTSTRPLPLVLISSSGFRWGKRERQ